MAHCFVKLDEKGKKVFLLSYNSATNEFKKEKHVLWGDWLTIDDTYTNVLYNNGEEMLAVIWSPNENPETLYIKKSLTITTRPLEIIFVDVGQGDGAVLITPERGTDEKILVIDAGETNDMKQFLEGRFKAYRGFNFEAAIITHPDADHYNGFKDIFNNHEIGFKTIYQNGLVERPVGNGFEKIGGKYKSPTNGKTYIKNLAETKADIEQHFADSSNFGRKVFPPLMYNALNNPKIKDFKILSTDAAHSVHENGRAYMPQFAPSDNANYSIEVLGPIVERNETGEAVLRKISSKYGITKNGHSIILRLHIGNFKILFGGDLNKQAEKFLLSHYAGLKTFPRKTSANYELMLTEAKKWFSADVMKVCHHGASDVTNEFMQTVNPACFVISSGDTEGHVHPRPDLLGRLGKFGKGEAPVILSTELQRSTREKEDQKKVNKLHLNIDRLTQKPNNQKLKDTITAAVKELAKTNVDVHGAIYLKTDGEKLITAFKFETATNKNKWFYYEYTVTSNGDLILC